MQDLEKQLENWLKVLHPNNYLILQIKKRLLDFLSLTDDPKEPAQLRAKLEKQVQLGEGTFLLLIEQQPKTFKGCVTVVLVHATF